MLSRERAVSVIEALHEAEAFAGLSEEECRTLSSVASRRTATAGEVLFKTGDPATELLVIRRGRVELTFPLLVMGESRETRFQSLEAGRTLAWSALVPPFRLTMSARCSTDAEILVLERTRLEKLFGERPDLAYRVMSNLSRVVAARLHEVVALWVREVQRNVSATYR